jgi:hypothetical protein
VVTNASGPAVNVHIDFTSGPATSDAATGGGNAPRQRAYDVASTDFWKDLNPFAKNDNGFDEVDAASLAKGDAKVPDALDTLVLTDDVLPGYALPPIPGQEVTPGKQADVSFAPDHPTAPCAYQNGTPRTPACSDGPHPFKVERGTPSLRVRIDFTAPNDLALEVVQRDAEGNEKNAYFQDGGEPSEVIDIPKPEPGDYEVWVHNFAAPQSDYTGKITFAEKVVPQRGASDYTDAEFDRYVGKIRDFVSGGGNLVLTDGALQLLPFLFDKIGRDKISQRTVYAGQVTFNTKATDSKDPTSEGNTLKDPLAARVAQPGARFNVGLRRQTYEPTPVGFSIQNAITGGDESHSREWEVDRKAFEAAGGRVVGTGVNSGTRGALPIDTVVTYGELSLGQGKVRVLGALLPQPTEEFDHQEGLESYALTYTGYELAQNLTDYCKPGRECKPIAQPGVRSVTKRATGACLPRKGFRRVKVSRRGRGLRLAFKRAEPRRVTIDVFRVSRGRRVQREHRVARFRTRKSVSWNGVARRFKAGPGVYFVRYRMNLGDGRHDIRRIVLEKRRGRFVKRPQFYGRVRCGLLRSFKLNRPVFGGTNARPLGLAYILGRKARVSVSVLRGKRVVKRFKTRTRTAHRTHRLKLRAAALRRHGDYRVRIRVKAKGRKAVTQTLTSRRL